MRLVSCSSVLKKIYKNGPLNLKYDPQEVLNKIVSMIYEEQYLNIILKEYLAV